MYDIKRKENETEYVYLWRLGQAKDNGLIDLDWAAIANIMNTEFRADETEYRTESAYRKTYTNAKKFQDAGVFDTNREDKYIKELQIQKREIEKERMKLQTEKLEYNRWLREEARDELITEKIVDAIASLPPIPQPDFISPEPKTKAYCLAFGDEHYGASFELKDLFGGIINRYSPEICEERMWRLLHRTIEIIEKEDIKTLNVFSLGDFSDGCLRVSQLRKLRYGVVDGTVRYANFLANWLSELTRYVRVNFQMTDGNHTELRMLGQPKGAFTEDNMGKVLKEIIKIRLEGNANFNFVENPTGYIYGMLACNTILGIHGEEKNMEKTLKDFSTIYNVPIQYLLAGHLHHAKMEEIGMSSEVINIPSIMGCDPYALSLHKVSDPAAKLLVFDQNYGKTCEYTIKLN